MLGLGLYIANNAQTTDCITMMNPNVELGLIHNKQGSNKGK